MKIFISRVSDQDLEMFDSDGLVGPDDDGDYFNQYVEYGSNSGGVDEFTIGDGCGRMVPFGIEAIDDLIIALKGIRKVINDIKYADELKEKIESDGTTCVDLFGNIDWDTESLQDNSGISW